MNEHEHMTGDDTVSSPRSFVGFIDWLNRKLFPILGTAQVGPYDPVIARVGEAICPVCGRPMSEHFIDHSTPQTILNCPIEHTAVPVDNSPVNELGMSKPSPEN